MRPSTPATPNDSAMKPTAEDSADSAAQRITARIRELDDWRGEMLARVRALILEADRDVVDRRLAARWRHLDPRPPLTLVVDDLMHELLELVEL